MKKAGRIHRPFQAQAFAFVMLCRFLADQFTAIGDSAVTAENIGSLEEAFNETLNALKAAEGAVSALQTFDVTNFTQNDVVQKFGKAESLIQETFKSFNLDAQWREKQAELHAALEKDIDRMAKLNDMFRKPQSRNSTTPKVKVTVSIHDKGGAHLSTASVEEESTIRLSALRWSVAGALDGQNIKRARTTGTFLRQTSGGLSEIPTTHETLADIANGNQQLNLTLVLS
ncbi:hypothetical protein BJV78DRAFT_418464 [Lactifluus subvellereus]|nr:hypothetical protein BJV78DRAFT_418464 [Lactifluus subvellereus]